MKFHLDKHSKAMLSALCAVAHTSGYRAQDLCITVELDENSTDPRYNGKARWEVLSMQSQGVFESPIKVEEPGKVVTNSYFLTQLGDSSDDNPWVLELANSKLKASLGRTVYEFDIGEPHLYQFEPNFCETDIDLSGFSANIRQFSDVIKLFVKRGREALADETGAVRICGVGNRITFEATDLRNALFGSVPVETTIDKEWRVLVPQSHFASWSNLPHNAYPLLMGVDQDSQMTLRCGPITVQHNTLTNLIDNMEDVASLADAFNQFNGEGADLEDLQMAMRYTPAELDGKVHDSTLYCDGDPTVLMDTLEDGSLNLIVRSTTVDSQLEMESTRLKIEKAGQASVNKDSLYLVNRVARLSSVDVNADKVDTWVVMRVFNQAIFVSSPDGNWIAMTAETSI